MKNLVKPLPTLALERSLIVVGKQRIAGVDEVGVGAIAGPLVAAAVALPLPGDGPRLDEELEALARLLGEVRDSKQLKADQRERLAALVRAVAEPHVGVAVVDVLELNCIGNQARAAAVTTARALGALPAPPDIALLDGTVAVAGADVLSVLVPKLYNGTTSLSIAAASLVASVAHHRLMVAYGNQYPAYGFERHNGHVSPAHLAALERHGPSPIHHRHSRLVQVVQQGDVHDRL